MNGVKIGDHQQGAAQRPLEDPYSYRQLCLWSLI